MIDFHSHILPGIDDGSKNAEMSLAMLRLLSEQRVCAVVATPHFYANRGTVDEFLERRERSFASLMSAVSDEKGLPQIKCGAEVRYYNGISRMQGLDKLTVDGGELLLLEMPETPWSEYMIKELIYISGNGKTRVALAHIERCIGFQKKDAVRLLHENGLLMQVNSEFITGFFTKHKALSMLKSGRINLIGSDAHNLTSRAPHIGDAFDLIEKKLGADFLSRFDKSNNSLLRSF